MKRKVTLSIEDSVYKQFQEFCEENDIMLSKRIERLIDKHLDEKGYSENKKNKKRGKK